MRNLEPLQSPTDVALETEKDAENGYLKKQIKLQETQMSAYMMLNETNDFMLEQ